MAQTPKFESGDRVRLNCGDRRINGRIGVVDSIHAGDGHMCVYVRLGKDIFGFATGELEIVEDDKK
jgi:hypothetical protein